MQETDVGYYFKTVRREWLELVVGGVNVDYKDTKHELGRWRMCSLAHGSQLCSSALWNDEHATTGGQIEISVWGDVFLGWRWKRIVIYFHWKTIKLVLKTCFFNSSFLRKPTFIFKFNNPYSKITNIYWLVFCENILF